MEKNLVKCVTFMLLILGIGTSNASLIFTDVSVTSHSVTFTVDGDMSGYSGVGTNTLFSIQYKGDLWAGLSTQSSNNWSSSVFDTHDFDHTGNTGIWASEWGYTWSRYDSSLAVANTTDRTVTVDLGNDFINPNAIAGELVFIIGTGNSLYPSLTTVLDTFSFTNDGITLSEPSTLFILAIGLAGVLFVRRDNIRVQHSVRIF